MEGSHPWELRSPGLSFLLDRFVAQEEHSWGLPVPYTEVLSPLLESSSPNVLRPSWHCLQSRQPFLRCGPCNNLILL